MPAAPFELLETEESTITIDSHCSRVVFYTEDKRLIPLFNEYTSSSNRCTLEETPCGGFKNSNVADLFPGNVTISGESCYLKNVAGTYIEKHISAGKLAENKEIVTGGSSGHSIYAADGIEVLTADNESVLVTPPYNIVCEFYTLNSSDSTQTGTITIRCPDNVSSIQLFNLDTSVYEDVTFTQVAQTIGTVNSYTCTRTLNAKVTEHLQIMITYSSLDFTFKFSNDAVQASGLHNLSSWLAYYDTSDTEIQFFLFSQTPESITCSIDSTGEITQFTFPVGSGAIYQGRVAHSAVSRVTSGEITDCLNIEVPGSISKFLKGFSAISTSTATITSYVVPAMSDDKILPKSSISSSYLSSALIKRMSPGEYSCASFVINSTKSVNLSILASDLVSGANTISKTNIDLKYVKCWWQAGNSAKSTHYLGRFLTPELLLNDDSLVQVWGDNWNQSGISNPTGKNYLKLNTGEYIDISSSDTSAGISTTIVPISEMPVYDADYLQILNLPSGYNKQIWITVHVPGGTAPGTYTGTITIRSDFDVLKTMSLTITVLDLDLPSSPYEGSIYYRARITDTGSISSEQKTVEQYTAELIDMEKHGISNPLCYTPPSDSTLSQVLSLRKQHLSNYNTMYMFGRTVKNITSTDLTNLMSACTASGIDTVYVYGYDETSMDTAEIRAQIQTVHDAGAYVFCSQSPTQALAVKDVLDLAIGNSTFTAAQIAEFQATGHQIYSYGNPQSVPEFPRTFRKNYGLFLWQRGYDGAAIYAYQHNFGVCWNDFDSATYRDHNFTYATGNGVVDTIQYEGYREGINDLRYLAALQAAIAANPGTTATTATTWLNTLKTTDLNTVDLDEVREQMIDYIIALQEA